MRFSLFKKKSLKFCKDCKYVGEGTYPYCLHDKAVKNGKLSLISGKVEGDEYNSCYLMRDNFCGGGCGKKAKYFEVKE